MGSDSPRFILRYVPGVPPNRVTTGTLDIETRIGVCHACCFVAETRPTGCRLFSNGLGLRERPSRAAIATAGQQTTTACTSRSRLAPTEARKSGSTRPGIRSPDLERVIFP